jgi:hypothetical protein
MLLALAGVFLQSSWSSPSSIPAKADGKQQFSVRGWPYVCELALPSGERSSFEKQSRLNLFRTAGFVLLAYAGVGGFAIRQFPRYELLDLIAITTGFATGLAYTSGQVVPNYLRTVVPLGFWAPEVLITDRTFAQRFIITVLIALCTYTVIRSSHLIYRILRRPVKWKVS